MQSESNSLLLPRLEVSRFVVSGKAVALQAAAEAALTPRELRAMLCILCALGEVSCVLRAGHRGSTAAAAIVGSVAEGL